MSAREHRSPDALLQVCGRRQRPAAAGEGGADGIVEPRERRAKVCVSERRRRCEQRLPLRFTHGGRHALHLQTMLQNSH